MHLLFAFLLLAQFGHRNNPGWAGPGTPVPSAATLSTTGATQCPGTGCLLVRTTGAATVVATIVTNASASTVEFVCTPDNGTTIVPVAAGVIASGAVGGSGQTTTTGTGGFAFPTYGYPDCGVYITSFAGNVTAKLDSDPMAFFSASQTFSPGHRTSITLNADGVTPAASNTLITFAKNVGGTVTGSLTSYTVTSGKTFRVQAIHFSKTDTTTTSARIVGYFRLNLAGTCVAGSGVVASCEIGDVGSAAPGAASQGGNSCTISMGDGYEIVGNGTIAICLTEASSTTSATLTADLIGYEY